MIFALEVCLKISAYYLNIFVNDASIHLCNDEESEEQEQNPDEFEPFFFPMLGHDFLLCTNKKDHIKC